MNSWKAQAALVHRNFLTGEMDIHEATQEKIMHYATQFENKLAQ